MAKFKKLRLLLGKRVCYLLCCEVIYDCNISDIQSQQQPAQSQCLIATAAFGSELSPQVNYLRHFRDQYILSTASGSGFMNTFNSIYYSFSPQVAEYEREQSWLQDTVKTALYPLFGILMTAERGYSTRRRGW
jgi:hypothetical protein